MISDLGFQISAIIQAWKLPKSEIRTPKLHQQLNRLLHNLLKGLQELRPSSTIHYPVIAGKGHFHDVAHHDFAIFHDWFFKNPAYSHDTGIGWIDDGGKFVDTKHTQVRNGEGIALHFIWLQFTFFGLTRQGFHLGIDLGHGFHVRITNHRNQQS